MTIRERPILMKGRLVNATLADLKTETRRAMNPQPSEGWRPAAYGQVHRKHNGEVTDEEIGWGVTNEWGDEAYRCPYGKPGDRLYVRETWRPEMQETHGALSYGIRYRADDHVRWDSRAMARHDPERNGWRPGIHLPKWASRLHLDTVDIVVERLQDITEEGALAEGVPRWANSDDIANGHYLDRPLDPMWCGRCRGEGTHEALGANGGVTYVDCAECDTPRKLFRNTWNSINEARGFGWDANPWLWVVKYRRIDS